MAKLKQSIQQGIIFVDDQYFWAQANDIDSPSAKFQFGTTASLPADQHFNLSLPTLVELSGHRPIFRKTHLPFNSAHKIQAVLPQEAADTLINPIEAPRFAFTTTPAAEGSEVFYAVTEAKYIDQQLARLATDGIKAQALTAPGLGAWPLLLKQKIIHTEESVWVMDASIQPQAFYQIKANTLQAVRLVSNTTDAQGPNTIAQELAWYLKSTEQTGRCRLVCLGMDRDFWRTVTAEFNGQVDIPDLATLLPTASGWRWIRPAGLALANVTPISSGQMLDFQQHAPSAQGWQSWLKPWRIPAALAALLVLIIGAQMANRYITLQDQYAQLQQNISDTFSASMPSTTVLIEPELQLRQAIATGSQGTYSQQLRQWIAYIQQTVAEETSVAWHQLIYDQGSIQLMGQIDSFEQLDVVKQNLQNIAAVKVQQAQIMRDSKRVQFTLELN